MALLLSALSDDNSAIQAPKISLSGPAHVKMSRMWIFALLKDRPTAAELEHVTVCETCASAFRAALGISSFGKGMKDQQLHTTEPPSSPGKDVPRAVA